MVSAVQVVSLPVHGAVASSGNIGIESVHPFLLQARQLEERMRLLRRAIHANPELAFQEFETSCLAATALRDLGFQTRIASSGTGLIADFGSGKGRTIAIKTELDALPLAESNQVAFRSRHANVMHACGHDAHIAAVIGAAAILAADKIVGRIRIIMQPGEHTADAANKKGSQHMITDGALNGVDALLGFHVDATMPFGQVGVVESSFASLLTKFDIQINQSFDSMNAVSKILPTLLDAGSSNSSKFRIINVAAQENSASISGIFQSDDIQQKEKQIQSLHDICNGVSKDQFKLTFDTNEESFEDHRKVIHSALNSAIEIAGTGSAYAVKRRTWTKEFAEYGAIVPAAFFLVGTHVHGNRTIQHTSSFDVDERVLPITAALLAHSVLNLLSDEK